MSIEEKYSEPTYVEGYHPSSLDAPHSSLNRSSTWVGAGFVLSFVVGAGIFVFGLATHTFETQDNSMFFLITGIIVALAFLVVGFGLIHHGRRYYRQYIKDHPEFAPGNH